MATITLELDQKKHGAFYISENEERFGEMAVSLKDKILSIYHTEIKEEAKGKGFGQQLFDNMLEYVAKEGLMVRPFCPFVRAMFDKNPEHYSPIWIKTT